MAENISWIATIATIIAASMTASNLGSRVTGYGFAVFLVGSVTWLTTGLLSGQPALVWTNVVLTILNIFGIWRWLGRQSRVEEGARSATQASEATPCETLFPVSLLTSAIVECSDKQVGTCVDAMAGYETGQLNYLVVSQGGVAGVGETLRRLSWRDAQVRDERVIASVSSKDFERLDQLPRDRWPAR